MKAVRFRVTGRVQGVGFRWFVVTVANELGLTGTVWNTRDGAVEGRVQGASTDKFLGRLLDGPGCVEDIVHEVAEPFEAEGFSIKKTV